MSNSIAKDMTTGPVLRQLASFALPIALANALQALYSMVDMVVVGQFVGADGLSAVGVGGQISNLMLCVGMGLGFGAQVLLSQQVGAADKDLQPTIGTLFTLEFLGAIVFSILSFLFAKPMLTLLNTPEEAYTDAYQYTVICCAAGLLFIFGYNAVCGILRGMGESKLPMVFVGIAAIMNLLLDLLFVAVFNLRAAGAALATVMSQAVAFIVAIIYLYRNRDRFGFDFRLRSFRPDRKRLVPILKVGIPYIVQSVMITVSMMFVNSNVNSYGVVASAADSIGNKLNSVVNIVIGAISMAGASMMGQCFGARKLDRIKTIFRDCTVICLITGVVLGACYLLFPRQIFGLFSTDADVLNIAPRYMAIAVVWLFSMITMTPPYMVIDGVGFASLGLIISIMDGVVARVGLCLILGRFMGLEGYWLGNGLAGFVTTFMAGAYYFSGKWKTRQLLLQQDPD